MFLNIEEIKLIIDCAFADADTMGDKLVLINKENKEDITVIDDYIWNDNILILKDRELCVTSLEEINNGDILNIDNYSLQVINIKEVYYEF